VARGLPAHDELAAPQQKKANKQLLSRLTDNLIHPGVRSRLAPVGLIALWADNDVHTFDLDETLHRIWKARAASPFR
jgi:hypothetical protein